MLIDGYSIFKLKIQIMVNSFFDPFPNLKLHEKQIVEALLVHLVNNVKMTNVNVGVFQDWSGC